MTNTNWIGLSTDKAQKTAEQLNHLLADYSIFYQNTRSFHWHIKGQEFFELHNKFEELYDDLADKIDEIAERILTLGHSPEHNYSEYFKTATIKETKEINDGIQKMNQTLDSFKTILIKQREILSLAAEANDEGTVALMSDYISGQEKIVWMYASFLGK